MVWRGAPRTIQQLHLAEFLQREAAPVCRRTRQLEPTIALAALLVAQHPQVSPLIPPQSAWTKQASTPLVIRFHRPFACNGGPDQPINVLNRLDLRRDNTHGSHCCT